MKKDKHPRWFKLDNAAKLYPSIMNTRVSTVFRVSAILDNQVDPLRLQKSLEQTIAQFPYFKVHLKRGVFWYYFDESKIMPKVLPETFYPCMFLNMKTKEAFPFRVVYYNQRVSCEFSHSITDGSGAFEFLKLLLLRFYVSTL